MKVLFTALQITALVLATTARADPTTDAKFIEGLDAGNVPYTSERNAIALAHVVCAEFRKDYPYLEVTTAVGQLNPTWTDLQQGFFVGAAVFFYCPDQRAALPV